VSYLITNHGRGEMEWFILALVVIGFVALGVFTGGRGRDDGSSSSVDLNDSYNASDDINNG